MCAIVDANVASEIFGSSQRSAGAKFIEWINKGKGQLVVGGKLLEELEVLSAFNQWSQAARLAGRIRTENENLVNSTTQKLIDEGVCRSNDPHVIALAQVSGARLLYSNDTNLHKDFKDKTLIDDPRGKVFSTNAEKEFTKVHQRLLGNKDLCRKRD